jgi:hypothetical protein
MLKPKGRILATDRQWDTPVASANFSDHVLTRVSAVKLAFVDVDFRYSTFDACYLRECSFDTCNFTGCRFLSTNFHGSHFSGCTFDYCIFERTQIDSEVLESCCPAYENLKMRFARTLRTNYQAIGDMDGVAKAILVELEAAELHLRKIWRSNESYYRRNYRGLKRVRGFFRWLSFKFFDHLWGNGEKPVKLVQAVIVLLVLIAGAHGYFYGNAGLVQTYIDAFWMAPGIFLGTEPSRFPSLVEAGIAFVRLTVIALFISVLVRRFARR